MFTEDQRMGYRHVYLHRPLDQNPVELGDKKDKGFEFIEKFGSILPLYFSLPNDRDTHQVMYLSYAVL